jgi:hypothetical protein
MKGETPQYKSRFWGVKLRRGFKRRRRWFKTDNQSQYSPQYCFYANWNCQNLYYQ